MQQLGNARFQMLCCLKLKVSTVLIAHELGDTIMICGDFNARASLWDQHGTNQHECALEAALSDVLFTPASTAGPTQPGTRHGDTDSTIDGTGVP